MGHDREMKILRKMDHPLVNKIADEFFYKNMFFIVTKFASEGDLEKMI